MSIDTWNPVRPLVQSWNTYRMDRYIKNELLSRFKSKEAALGDKIVVDLAMNAYFAEFSGQPAQKIDTAFTKYALSQVKLFIYGGYDTTATTICYLYLLLSRNPRALQKLRAEHDAVLGKDIDAAGDLMLSQPHTINQLPYTFATYYQRNTSVTSCRYFAPRKAVRIQSYRSRRPQVSN